MEGSIEIDIKMLGCGLGSVQWRAVMAIVMNILV
jgi:hypothetical protein